MRYAASIVGKIFLGLLLCLGLVSAERSLGVDCRTEGVRKVCACCAQPDTADCCAAGENQHPKPVMPAPAAADAHLDLALVNRPVELVLPVAERCQFSGARKEIFRFASRPSLQALHCLRTV